jgi:predicted O-methyltransferase YrrM
MILEERFLSKEVAEYVLNNSANEPQLMANLRQETMSSTECPQMICGPVEGQLLNMLVKFSNAKHVLEIGTFTGYSALYIASALGDDSKLTTCEIDERHANTALKYFARSPWAHKIDLKLAPALETIKKLDGPFDLVFLDADKKGYPKYYEETLAKVRQGGLIVIDNTFWGGKVLAPNDLETKTIAELNESLRDDPRVDVLMLAIRDGITLCIKK